MSQSLENNVILTPYSRDAYMLVENFFYSSKRPIDIDIVVPAGFITNGVDIPRIFWSLYPPNKPEYLNAAVIHDYMLGNPELYNRELADKVFYQALLDFGTSNFTAKIFYNFVKYKHIIRSKLK